MEEIQQAILNFFSNEKLLKQIRTISIILIILIVPIVWFGFKDTITFGSLWTWAFGSIILVITFSVLLATIETKSIAFDYTVELDEDIIPNQSKIEVNSKTINELDKTGKESLLWCNQYNVEQQATYDLIKTNEQIDLYEKRALRHRLNGKDKKAEWYDKQIERLKKEPLTDKKFTPYDVKRIRNVNKIGIKLSKKKGNTEIKSNPKQLNLITILLSMPIRALGLGLLGTIPFVVNESIGTVLLFYIGYLLTMIVTIISQYLITSYKTTHSYKMAQEKIITLQGLLIAHLQPKEKATV
jgi:hypothetical protein